MIFISVIMSIALATYILSIVFSAFRIAGSLRCEIWVGRRMKESFDFEALALVANSRRIMHQPSGASAEAQSGEKAFLDLGKRATRGSWMCGS
jgi:hypothetical protein